MNESEMRAALDRLAYVQAHKRRVGRPVKAEAQRARLDLAEKIKGFRAECAGQEHRLSLREGGPVKAR